MAELKFDSILPVEVPVLLGEDRYVLKEPSGEVTDGYKRTLSSFASVEGGKVTIANAKDALTGVLEAGKALLGDCLHDPKGNPVGIEFVKKLPVRVRDPLVEAVLDISGLKVDDEKEKKLKNSSSGTTDGSASPTS